MGAFLQNKLNFSRNSPSFRLAQPSITTRSGLVAFWRGGKARRLTGPAPAPRLRPAHMAASARAMRHAARRVAVVPSTSFRLPRDGRPPNCGRQASTQPPELLSPFVTARSAILVASSSGGAGGPSCDDFTGAEVGAMLAAGCAHEASARAAASAEVLRIRQQESRGQHEATARQPETPAGGAPMSAARGSSDRNAPLDASAGVHTAHLALPQLLGLEALPLEAAGPAAEAAQLTTATGDAQPPPPSWIAWAAHARGALDDAADATRAGLTIAAIAPLYIVWVGFPGSLVHATFSSFRIGRVLGVD